MAVVVDAELEDESDEGHSAVTEAGQVEMTEQGATQVAYEGQVESDEESTRHGSYIRPSESTGVNPMYAHSQCTLEAC